PDAFGDRGHRRRAEHEHERRAKILRLGIRPAPLDAIAGPERVSDLVLQFFGVDIAEIGRDVRTLNGDAGVLHRAPWIYHVDVTSLRDVRHIEDFLCTGAGESRR